MSDKIKVPFWLHIFVFVIVILMTIITGYFVSILGLIIIYWFLPKEFENNLKKGKDPYTGYLGSAIIYIATFNIFGAILDYTDKLTIIITITMVLILSGVAYSIVKICEKLRRSNYKLANPIMVTATIVTFLLIYFCLFFITDAFNSGLYLDDENYSNFELYDDNLIYIMYPDYMSPEEPVQDFVYKLFLDEFEDEDDLFQENFIVIIGDSEDLSLEEATDLSLQGLDELNYNLVFEVDEMLMGADAKRLIYTYEESIGDIDYKLKSQMVNTIVNNVFVSLIYTAEEDKFDDYLTDVNLMVESFWVY